MKSRKESFEDELYVDPRPLNEKEKKMIDDFIESYSRSRRSIKKSRGT